MTDAQEKIHIRGHHGGIVVGKVKNMMEERGVEKNIVNEFSKINLINNTSACPHISVNGDRIADSGSTIHCYFRDTTTDNDRTAAALHTVQTDGSKIVSILQTNIKVYTLNK